MGTSTTDPSRRFALIALIAVAGLFIVELIALIMGWFGVAVVCGALLIASWFVMRAFVKRRERESGG